MCVELEGKEGREMLVSRGTGFRCGAVRCDLSPAAVETRIFAGGQSRSGERVLASSQQMSCRRHRKGSTARENRSPGSATWEVSAGNADYLSTAATRDWENHRSQWTVRNEGGRSGGRGRRLLWSRDECGGPSCEPSPIERFCPGCCQKRHGSWRPQLARLQGSQFPTSIPSLVA